jgi:hypothetical protein
LHPPELMSSRTVRLTHLVLGSADPGLERSAPFVTPEKEPS